MKERKKNNKKDEERDTQKVHNLLRQSLTHKQKDKKTKGKKERITRTSGLILKSQHLSMK